jgi:hypothetical protein
VGNNYKHKFDPQFYIKAAKELRYSEDIIKRLENAPNDEACSRIMHTARTKERA